MHSPIPQFPPSRAAESHEHARAFLADVQWNRPIFKAPPLEPLLRGFDVAVITQELRRVGLSVR